MIGKALKFGKFFSQTESQPIKIEPQAEPALERFAPLIELQQKRQLVQVSVQNKAHPHDYQSMIMGLDYFSETLYLDTLTPQNRFYPIQVGDTLTITHHCNGQILSFHGILKGITAEDMPMYIIQLPHEIAYTSRRFYPRWTPDNMQPISARILSPASIPWSARVLNLSAGGARIAVGGKLARDLQRQSELGMVRFTLPNGVPIECKGKVKTFRYSRRPYEHTAISLSFSEINFQDRLKIQNFVAFQLDPTERDLSEVSAFH